MSRVQSWDGAWEEDPPGLDLLGPGPSHPVTQPHGEGESSPGRGPGPLRAEHGHPSLIWRAEHHTAGNLTTSGAGGRQVFHFSARCLARVLRKKGGRGEGSTETSQKYHKRRRRPEGDTRSDHPSAQACRPSGQLGLPHRLQPPTGTASKTPPNPLSLTLGKLRPQAEDLHRVTRTPGPVPFIHRRHPSETTQ